MNYLNFINYYEKEEKDNGDYWKFLNSSINEINEAGIYLEEVCNTIINIKNKELKEKMKKKLIELIKKNGIENMSYHIILKSNLFTEDERKNMIDSAHFINNLNDDNNIDFAFKYIRIYFEFADDNWVINNIKNIINKCKNKSNYKKVIVFALEYANHSRKEIYDELLNEYKDILPDYYKNFLTIESDNCYIHRKALHFEKEKIKIGIDPKISIGVEIEGNQLLSKTIDMDNQKDIKKYYSNGNDDTVDKGTEITSKPFHDTKEDVARLCAVCEALKETGVYYDEKKHDAAGQINLGLDYLDTPRSIIYFYEIFCNCEELLYYISNEKGQLVREPINKNKRFNPISGVIGKRIINEDITREEAINLFKVDMMNKSSYKGLYYKSNSVCLRGNSEDRLRLEIRIPNGSVNYKTWIDNIRLYGKIMEVSKNIDNLMKKDYLTSEETKLIKNKIRLEYGELSIEEKLNTLMNMLFDDDDIKQIYIDRYKATIDKIKKTKSNLYIIPNDMDQKKFSEVEFKEKYESKIDKPGIIYDYETDTYTNERIKEKHDEIKKLL